MAAAAATEEFAETELEVAAILCGFKPTLLARQRRFRRMMQRLHASPEIPSWGRRRPRSVLEEKAASAPAPSPAAATGATERDGAASPDTPLAYPESGGDDAPAEEDVKKPTPTSHDQWVQQQHGVVASLAQENAHLLEQIEEYKARLQGSRSTNESLKQLHKVKREREEEEQARKKQRVVAVAQAPGAADPRVAVQAPAAAEPRMAAAAALGLDLNEPARAPDENELARAQQAEAAAAAAAEWYRQAQMRAAMQKAATAGARRRRLEILRAKVACPLVSSRPRRAG